MSDPTLLAALDSLRAEVVALRESQPEQWLTPAEAGEVLDLSAQALAAARSEGRGPRYARVGRLIRYRRSDLDEWLGAHLVTPGIS